MLLSPGGRLSAVTLLDYSGCTLDTEYSIEKDRTMKRFGTGILLVVAAFLLSVFLLQAPRPVETARRQAAADIKPASKPAAPPPAWAVAYDREFWRQSPPPLQTLTSNSPAVNIHDVVDRVSHAFRPTDGASPTVTARDYTANLDGASLHFSPGTSIDLKITTTSAKIGDDEILKSSVSATGTHYVGNTAQTILDPTAGLIQHLEARAQGLELTWILQHRPDSKGPLRIEAAV